MADYTGKKIAVATLGCKLNFAESSAIARKFVQSGFQEVSAYSSGVDVCVVNTCTVTEHSDKKCRNIIRRIHKLNPGAIIAVTGCYATLKKAEIEAIEGVSIVLEQDKKGSVYPRCLELLEGSSCSPASAEHIFPACSFGERTRSFLKVQDGCNYFCTYCAIPYARGRSRSVPLDVIEAQAKELSCKGVKEIVLTGVNIGDYEGGLLPVLKALGRVDGIERYRISSIEPNLLTDQMIDWISSGTKFQPHFHIPLQSGSDSVLSRMHRKYDTALFASKIEYIRKAMGDVFFGIDVIAGFPGETEEEFDSEVSFIRDVIKPAFLHVFPYSRRKGTLADRMEGHLPEIVKTARVRVLEDLSDSLHAQYRQRFDGSLQQVLWEGRVKGNPKLMGGYTGNYLRVERPYDQSLIGHITEVEL
ncbi:MAG: tRNA (N(6)-L-threonylcarbamoyladenosine(37)-C(2))-methylthiotransferase MtaB [Bacteroidales bacterium]|nr:tRNA (N(6)-L-threonylcarbamoyladenosine(37)-C(2))-methylthiotransferase MtaB [Bacteroidales bacterium]MBQ2491765.1 tRNA (N(6)-L-threonylcarbamoyladenosine(37)-C(2))-methylthiotransferase MtaB [Bacteroidales bacterium]